MATGADVLLAVGYWPKYAVVEELLGTPRSLLDALAALFPPADLTLWLDLAPEVAAARRQAFSTYECGGEEPSPAAFARFQARCRQRLGMRAEEGAWLRVDAAGDEDEVAARLLAGLDRGLQP
jgi:thymidylate kinase